MVKALVALATLVLLALIALAPIGADAPGVRANPDADGLDVLLPQMLGGLSDFFSTVAQMSAAMEYELVRTAPPAVQAVFGALICLRTVLVVVGILALSAMRRAARRVLG